MNENYPKADNSGAQWRLDAPDAYANWRAEKLRNASRQSDMSFVQIADLANPTALERNLILTQCSKNGSAFYETTPNGADLPAMLIKFAAQFGLNTGESHRSSQNGVVALRVTASENQRGFIPYSRKPMNWHTDGYYNAPSDAIRSFVLHCAQPAVSGGQNQLIDPEIAYLRLRDSNPDFIAALMADDAMTIPENTEADGSVRPTSIGPVFKIDSGALTMRYTARTRSIEWSVAAKPAAAALQNILENESEYRQQATLTAGQGILSNNALHNRTGFDPQQDNSNRLMYRIRFHNRIKGT